MDLPNVAEMECGRCGMTTTHERTATGMGCIRCRVIDAHLASTRPTAQRSQRGGMPLVRLALNVAALIFLGAVGTCGYVCVSVMRPGDKETSATPAASAYVESTRLPADDGDPTLRVTPGAKGKQLQMETSAAIAVSEWCGRGKVPFWRGRAITVSATYVDDRKANLVNVSVDHPRKDEQLGGHTLAYEVRFRGGRPATITARKDISALACRKLEPGVEQPLE
jgi:hypothetical protein